MSSDPSRAPARLLHVLGAGPWQVPTVQLAQAMGYRVLVSDMYRERPAYTIADLHEVADITDREATLAVARRHHIDGVICDSTDVGVPTAAYVAQTMGLPGMGLEVALNCTHKLRMRQLTASSGLRFCAIRELAQLPGAIDAVGLPLVIKPADNQAGRGVQILRQVDGAKQAFERALALSRCGQVLLEQHLSGTELIVDGFVTDAEVQVLAVAVKSPYADNPTISACIHYPPVAELPVTLTELQQAAQHTITALGLRQGVFHAEFMAGEHGIVPIDVAARGGGVLIYRRVIPHVSGVDVNRAMIELALGQRPLIQPRSERRVAHIEFLRLPIGRVLAVLGLPAASAVADVAEIVFNVKAGDHVGPLHDKDQRPGYIVALSDSSEAAIQACQQAKALMQVRMDNFDEPVALT